MESMCFVWLGLWLCQVIFKLNNCLLINQSISNYLQVALTEWFFAYLIPGLIGILDLLVFEGRGKPEYREKKTDNKLNPHMVLTLGFEPGNVSGRQVPSSLRQPCSPSILIHVHPFSGNLARGLAATTVELECLENSKIYIAKQNNIGKFVTAGFENYVKGMHRTQNKFEILASLVD